MNTLTRSAVRALVTAGATLAAMFVAALFVLAGSASAAESPQPLTPEQMDIAAEGIDYQQECILQTADGTVYGLVSSTDPQCFLWYGDDSGAAPDVPTFAPVQRGAEERGTVQLVSAERGAEWELSESTLVLTDRPDEAQYFTCWEGMDLCVTSFSPSGAEVVEMFKDGSAVYGDGTVLVPAGGSDAQASGTMLGEWEGGPYGAGASAVCGTDAQCAALDEARGAVRA